MWQRILLILGYCAGALLVVGGTIILVALGRGYSYDFASGRFILNGLIIFRSNPGGAAIYLESKDTRRRTPYRTTLEAGLYNFELRKEGYQTWRKRLEVVASGVTQANYIWLFPTKISSRKLTETAPVVIQPNPNRQQLAYIIHQPSMTLAMLDVASGKSTSLYTSPAPAAGAPAEVLQEVNWSADASHLLLKVQRGEQTVYLVVEAGGDHQVTDVTALFRFDFNNLRFGPGSWEELYWISPEGLRRLNIADRTVSAPLAEQVLAFTYGGGRIYYVQATALGKALWSIDDEGRKHEISQSLAESDSYALTYSNYQDHARLAVIPNRARSVTLYSEINSAHPTTKVLGKSVDQLKFSPDGRFLAFYSGDNLGTYDLQRGRLRRINLGEDRIGSLSWFDNHHLVINTQAAVKVMEFDGANLTTIKPAAGLPAQVSPDRKQVIYLTPTQRSLRSARLR